MGEVCPECGASWVVIDDALEYIDHDPDCSERELKWWEDEIVVYS